MAGGTRVIEGRGISDFATYLEVERTAEGVRCSRQPGNGLGPLRGIPARVRSDDAPLADPEWVMQLALDALRRQPTGRPFEAIIVDEAQDVTEVGLRFLLELLEGGSNGRLLLVGDQSQRIYAGGFRLSDAGVDVRGRSFAFASVTARPTKSCSSSRHSGSSCRPRTSVRTASEPRNEHGASRTAADSSPIPRN